MSVRWFGGPGQPPGICEVPLESFRTGLDTLCELHAHVAVIGLSKGAEASLLLAAHDPRIRVVVALSPSAVVWANVGAGRDGSDRPQRSSWSLDGQPLPFVPYDEQWQPAGGEQAPSFRGLYEQSLQTFASEVPAATIPVERIQGSVVLAAGGDDQVWPAVLFAEQIRTRRSTHALHTDVITHPDAGHRFLLPGEPSAGPTGGQVMSRGGSHAADRALGQQLWDRIRVVLQLDEDQQP
ncbi:MAG: acyl-CoA thioesterase [Frankiales bacterium]|nr:MAG: acyl-CoA thioesterase [Frankiales bacterium]